MKPHRHLHLTHILFLIAVMVGLAGAGLPQFHPAVHAQDDEGLTAYDNFVARAMPSLQKAGETGPSAFVVAENKPGGTRAAYLSPT